MSNERDRHKIIDSREDAGLSQQQLANRLGVSVRTVSRWESGAGTLPDDALERVEEAINQTLDAQDPEAARRINNLDLGLELVERLRQLTNLERENRRLRRDNERYSTLYGQLPL